MLTNKQTFSDVVILLAFYGFNHLFCVSGVKSCIRNSQISYSKAHSILKNSFVNYRVQSLRGRSRISFGIAQDDTVTY